jgi:hypothetical protein
MRVPWFCLAFWPIVLPISQAKKPLFLLMYLGHVSDEGLGSCVVAGAYVKLGAQHTHYGIGQASTRWSEVGRLMATDLRGQVQTGSKTHDR